MGYSLVYVMVFGLEQKVDADCKSKEPIAQGKRSDTLGITIFVLACPKKSKH